MLNCRECLGLHASPYSANDFNIKPCPGVTSSDGARSKIIWAMAKLELKLDKLVSQAERGVGLLED
jgi:hypothetical protein